MDGQTPSPRSPGEAPARWLATLAALLISMAAACGVDVVGDDPPLDAIYDPVGIALHPSGQYLYVVNSNFDLDFREDRGGTVVAIDTDTLEVIPSATVQIGTFGGDIVLNSPAEGPPTRAYVAVRGDKTVTALDLSATGAQLSCKGGRLTAACRIPTLNDDPFGLAVTSSEIALEGRTARMDFIGVAHLLGGNVTGLTVLDDEVAAFSRVSAPLVSGANDVALSPRNGQFYTTSRFSNAVVAFRPVIDKGKIAGIFETAEVTIDNARPAGGFDSRGIAFNAEGTLAFVANRGPDSLVFIDVGPTDPQTGSGTRNVVVDVLFMPNAPAEIAVIDVGGKTLLYVTSFEGKAITVVDPESRAVVDNIDLFSGPYGVAVDQERHKRLYVTLFGDDAVGIIDIDPASPSFNTLSGVIR